MLFFIFYCVLKTILNLRLLLNIFILINCQLFIFFYLFIFLKTYYFEANMCISNEFNLNLCHSGPRMMFIYEPILSVAYINVTVK